MRNHARRFLAWLLTVVMMISSVPGTAFAESTGSTQASNVFQMPRDLVEKIAIAQGNLGGVFYLHRRMQKVI